MKVYAVNRSPPSRNQVMTVPKRRPPSPPLVQQVEVASLPARGHEAEHGDEPEQQDEDDQGGPVGVEALDGFHDEDLVIRYTKYVRPAVSGTHANWYQ
jgi:hypothetical protein